jgi:hypothetical protein
MQGKGIFLGSSIAQCVCMHAFASTGQFISMVLQVGGKRVGWAEFFRLSPNAASTGAVSAEIGANSNDASWKDGQQEPVNLQEGSVRPVAPAAFVQPLYISKLNTVFQLFLIAGCIGRSWYGWPPEDMLWALSGITGLTTLGSFMAYLRVYKQGKLLSS